MRHANVTATGWKARKQDYYLILKLRNGVGARLAARNVGVKVRNTLCVRFGEVLTSKKVRNEKENRARDHMNWVNRE